MPRLFLIDGTALAYRSHFAFSQSRRGGLTTRQGLPTSATFGFAMSLRALLEREKPDAIAIAFDGPREELLRTRLYPEYKSTREKMPEELVQQLPYLERMTKAFGIPIVASDGHEADDVIGTLAVRGKEAGFDVFIVTGDKDFMQLVDSRIKLWNLRSPTTSPEILGPDEVHAKWGVAPAQMIDLLALMGDSSDNVPGVPGVGEKTAAELIREFGTLDATLAGTAKVKKKKVAANLQEHAGLARLSRQLVTIHTDVPVHIAVTELGPAHPDRKQLEALYRELEFESLLGTLPREAQAVGAQDYRIVTSDAQLDELRAELRKAKRFAFDTETTSLDTLQARIVGMSFCTVTGRAWYVPFNHGFAPPEALLAALRGPLEDRHVAKIGQNCKYDRAVLLTAGVEAKGYVFDTMLASYLLSPGIGQHNLDALALRWFGYQKIPTSELIGTGKKQITFDKVPIDKAGRYACEDADFTWRVHEKLAAELDRAGLRELFDTLEMPLIEVLLGMEREGITLDTAHLARLAQEWQVRLDAMEKRVHERAGQGFNLNSAQQVAQVLFEKLEVHKAAGISKPRKTATGQYKTDAEVLEKLARHHEVPQLLLEYRQLSKLKGTYVDALPRMVSPVTGRVHTSFNQAVAATGRLSSDDPNLQNIPIRTAEGREVRKAFVPRAKGWVLLSADYSQIELRILAHMSGDATLREAFRRREDIHTKTAAIVHGLLPGMVTPELRSQAKIINYGLIYGMGASRLAQETGMTPAEAKRFIDSYFKALPGVKRFIDATLARARETKEVVTLCGRKRPLPDITSDDPMRRIQAENMAINTPIQGTAADIIKKAMLRLHAGLASHKLRARLLLQVHDELVLDVPVAEVDAVTALVREAMEGAVQLDVPLEVSVGHGDNWLLAHH